MHPRALLSSLLFACVLSNPAAAADPVRVLVWDEQQPEQKKAYGDKFLGETIAAHLATLPGLTVKSVNLKSPEQGLDSATLDKTDVIVWWGHVQHQAVNVASVERVVERVLTGRLSLVALHSAHWSRPFVRLMQERARTDAIASIPANLRAAATIASTNEQCIGVGVKPDARLTPFLEKTGDTSWQLTLPACVFPAYRPDGAPSHVTTLLPNHPIASGLPAKWDISQTEMYSEPFHVPKPDAVIFEERWDKGEWFRSGCLWNIGSGRVFYFRPGHESYPVFTQPTPLRVIENAVRFLAIPATK
jgi:trehalose utilization protein